jgi:hypothetical protein
MWIWPDMATRGFSMGLRDSQISAMLPALQGLGIALYVADHDRKDPVLSPMYADLKGFSPTLCMTSTRDHCLSGTVDFHRAQLRAGMDARLTVFLMPCPMRSGTGSTCPNPVKRWRRRRDSSMIIWGSGPNAPALREHCSHTFARTEQLAAGR